MSWLGLLGLLFGLMGVDASIGPRGTPADSARLQADEATDPFRSDPSEFPDGPSPGPTHPDEWQPESEVKDLGDGGVASWAIDAIVAPLAGPRAWSGQSSSPGRGRARFLISRRC